MKEQIQKVKTLEIVHKTRQIFDKFIVENLKTMGIDENTAYIYLAIAVSSFAALFAFLRLRKIHGKDKEDSVR